MKSTTITAIFLVLVGTIHCVDWANLTAAELSQLPQDAFTTITASELGSIPPPVSEDLNPKYSDPIRIKMTPLLRISINRNRLCYYKFF